MTTIILCRNFKLLDFYKIIRSDKQGNFSLKKSRDTVRQTWKYPYLLA